MVSLMTHIKLLKTLLYSNYILLHFLPYKIAYIQIFSPFHLISFYTNVLNPTAYLKQLKGCSINRAFFKATSL